MAKKLTLRQKYLKEVAKIEKRYIKAVGKGFVDTNGKYSDEYGNFTWKIPKRIGTRELERIKKHSQKYMYENMSFWHPVYKKFVSGRAGAEYVRSEAGKKAWRTRQQKEQKKPPKTAVMAEYRDLIESVPDERYIKGRVKISLVSKKNELKSALQSMYDAAEDKKAYCDYLESKKDEFTMCIRGMIEISELEGIEQSFARALAIIKNGPITIEESKSMEDLNDLPF